MTTALIGAFGQLGSDLRPIIRDCVPLGRQDIEITEPRSVAAALDAVSPDIVINCAAYNLVDQAEDEPDRAYAVNALGPRCLAQWCRTRGAKLVQISTDYIFGIDKDRRTPYCEGDLPGPLGAYGVGKLAGEMFVQAECDRHLIIRTCGLYGHQATRSKGNFVTTMLRLGSQRSELRVVDDQWCTPSHTRDVALGIRHLLDVDAEGVFHLTNAGETNWCELAKEIFRRKRMNVQVIPIPSSEYPTKARRPRYSVLDCSRYESVAGKLLPDWKEALAEFLAGLPA